MFPVEYANQLLKESKQSQQQVATKMGISQRAVSRLLHGDTPNPRLMTAINFARAVGIHPIDLIRRCTNPTFKSSINIQPLYPNDGTHFIDDVTIPDYEEVTVGKTFTKTWRIQNGGDVTWKNRKLICVDDTPETLYRKRGETFIPLPTMGLTPVKTEIDVPLTNPSVVIDLSVELIAPQLPCTSITYWKMANQFGELCFPEHAGLWCVVKVVAI